MRIDAVAICATDLDVIAHGPPALIQGGLPFNKNWTPGHEYMGTVAALGPGVDEFAIGERVTVEIHAGCGQCKRCRMGMYTSCLNYGLNYGEVDKGHRANGFTTDGGFAEYAVNNINTLIKIADTMSDEEATLVVTAGTAMYGLTELGGLVAGESVVVIGPGPDRPARRRGGQGARRLAGDPDRHARCRLQKGRELGADHVVNVTKEDAVEAVRRLNGGKGVDYVIECSGAPDAINEAGRMLNRGGKICLAAFPHEPVPVDVAHLVRNNIYVYGIRGEGRSATHRAEAFMRDEALRRQPDPHPHLPARRAAGGAALRPRPRRGRHQGGGEDAVTPSPPLPILLQNGERVGVRGGLIRRGRGEGRGEWGRSRREEGEEKTGRGERKEGAREGNLVRVDSRCRSLPPRPPRP